MQFDALTLLQPLIKDGKLRALAVTTPTRWPDLPDVPTMREAGFADFPGNPWAGIMAPPNMPAPIVGKLNATLNDILRSPKQGEPGQAQRAAAAGSPEEFAPSSPADAGWTNGGGIRRHRAVEAAAPAHRPFTIPTIIEILLDFDYIVPYSLNYGKDRSHRRFGGTRPGQPPRRISPAGQAGPDGLAAGTVATKLDLAPTRSVFISIAESAGSSPASVTARSLTCGRGRNDERPARLPDRELLRRRRRWVRADTLPPAPRTKSREGAGMSIDRSLPVAVIGAGPVGLARPRISSPAACRSSLRSGRTIPAHVRIGATSDLFSPWRLDTDSAGNSDPAPAWMAGAARRRLADRV